jgi:hypothetical protein
MDGNGAIDDYEFICGLALFMKTKLDQRLEAVFQLYDTNNSQTIDNDEFKDLVEAVLSLNLTRDIDPARLEKKMADLKSLYFLTTKTISIDQFVQMAKYDKDLNSALIEIGVITFEELEKLGGDPDLAAEEGKLDYYVEKESQGDQSMPNQQATLSVKGLEQLGFGSGGESGGGGFEVEAVDGGDQFMAVKPWKGAIRNAQPSWYKPSATEADPPNATLEMKYIHGYRCHDTRNNIFYTPEGHLTYHTAKVGIQLNTKENIQKFVVRNVDDIISMACWENLCATGDITDKPALVLWDNVTMQPLAEVIGLMRKGIAMITFSKDGKYLACSCMDADSTVWVLEVQKLKDGMRESRSLLNNRSCRAQCQRSEGQTLGFEVRSVKQQFDRTLEERNLPHADSWIQSDH